MKIHNVFHVDRLIPFNETQEYGVAYPQPPPELIDGEEEYEVEEILDDRIKPRTCNQKQYYMKWKGYAQSENSWVDKKDLRATPVDYPTPPLSPNQITLLDPKQPFAP